MQGNGYVCTAAVTGDGIWHRHCVILVAYPDDIGAARSPRLDEGIATYCVRPIRVRWSGDSPPAAFLSNPYSEFQAKDGIPVSKNT
jgi:hypothetical protein